MSWLNSRRLRYWLGGVAIWFGLLAALRTLFFYGFSGLDSSALERAEVLRTLGIGLRFDLRYFSNLKPSDSDEGIAIGRVQLSYWTANAGVVFRY